MSYPVDWYLSTKLHGVTSQKTISSYSLPWEPQISFLCPSLLSKNKNYNIVACLLKARIVKPAETAVARERLCKGHVTVATVTYASMEVPLGTVFSMRSAPTAKPPDYGVTARRSVFVGSAQRLFKESRLELWVSSEIVSGPADSQSEEGGHGQSSEVWSWQLEEMVASLWERDTRSRWTSAVSSQCQATTSEDYEV
jgi:hypothetical protein